MAAGVGAKEYSGENFLAASFELFSICQCTTHLLELEVSL
jgi:hypothetical protein